jgi:hypothetical protein
MWGVTARKLGESMLRSKMLLVSLALTTVAVVATGHSSLGEAKGDECRAKPDGSSPAGMHWYYRVDRANNRHCWYLHEQGMPVHSSIHATARNPDAQNDVAPRNDAAPQNDAADEQVWKTPPITGTPQPQIEQSATPAEPPNADFTGRWVDLPKSVDLNAHEPLAASNGYAAEQSAGSGQGQLPPALADVSAVNADARQNTGSHTNFGSISLAGAMVLALLLISEALIRLVRTSGWRLLRRHVRLEPAYYSETPAALDAAPDPCWRNEMRNEPMAREHGGVRELQRLLQRADTELRPPRSFAPSRPAQHREHANHSRTDSAVERLKSRSFSDMTWAPL